MVTQEKLTPRQRFLKYAPTRTSTVLKGLRQLGNCTNRQGYEAKAEEWQKILGAVDSAVAILKGAADRMLNQSVSEPAARDGFTLDD